MAGAFAQAAKTPQSAAGIHLTVRAVEIAYRYGAPDAPVPPRPADAKAARQRLDAGSRSFASLLEGLEKDGESARRVIQVDPYDLGLDPSEHAAPRQRPFAAVLGCSDARAARADLQ
jgi:carbonic anhydrase